MFQHTWFAAERLLAQAGTWVFIGYSLPAADFEFKYLLKRTQLARRRPARIVVVTGGGKRATKDTVENYQRFFGSNLRQDDVFENEIDETVIERL